MKTMIILLLIAACAWLPRGIRYVRQCRQENIPFKTAVKTACGTPCMPMPDAWLPVRDTVVMYVELLVLVGILLSKLVELSMFSNAAFLSFFQTEAFYWPILLTLTLLLAKFTIPERVFMTVLEIGLFVLGRDSILVLLLLILTATDFGLRKTMKVYLALLGAFLVTTAVLSTIGVIQSGDKTVAETRGDAGLGWLSVRHAFGLYHPNITAVLLAIWSVMWFMLRYPNLTWRDWVIALIFGVVITVVIDSRGTLLFYAAFLFLFAVLRKWPRLLNKTVLRGIAVVSPVLCALLSYAAARFYNADNKIWSLLNRFSTGRLSLFHSAFNNSAFSLMGRPVSELKIISLDNTYLFALWVNGIAICFCFLAGYVLLLHRLWKRKAIPELAMTLAFVVYFSVENMVTQVNANITLLMFGSILLLRSAQKQDLFSESPYISTT